jgi:phosphate transport system substrate-binding protein
MIRRCTVLSAPLLCAVFVGCAATPTLDPSDAGPPPPRAQQALAGDALPAYESVANLRGVITSIGASTTTNLVARASTQFRRIYPDVRLQVSAGLTSIGPPALLEGRANLVPMSRPLTREEIRAFQAKYGYPPTEIPVAADALAIYVEKRNPLPGLTIAQLGGIFSAAPRGGALVETWGQAGLTGEWADRRINLYGYGPEDGVNQIFRQQVLDGSEYRLAMLVEPAGSSIVQGVAADPAGIGCASIFFLSQRVRAVPLVGADGLLHDPTATNVHNRSYPLIRYLSICVNKPPHRPLRGPAAEFLRFLLSREGQEVVAAEGNIPLDAQAVQQGRWALDAQP